MYDESFHGSGVAAQRILGYAAQRFREEGFARVSVDELCAGLSMSKKTFYAAFPGKEALVETIALNLITEIERGVNGIARGDLPFLDKVRGLMAFMGERVRQISALFLRDLQRHTPQIWERVQRFRREKVLTIFADLVAEGKRLGMIRPDVNTRVFLLAYIGAIEAVLVPSVLTDESFSGEEALRSILTIYFNGVLTADAGSELALPQQPH